MLVSCLIITRSVRIEFPGATYHVMSRGVAGQKICLDNADRRAFLEVLNSVVGRCDWICYAFCLMNSHYHLLIETLHANLSVGMKQLNGVYAQVFNQKHNRDGHLMQGRYTALLVDKDNYFLGLSRYIVLNPVRADHAGNASEWPWSSYRATAGLQKAPRFLDTSLLLDMFSTDIAKARQEYADFVCSGNGSEIDMNPKNGLILGSDSFIEELELTLEEKRSISEYPLKQRFVDRQSLESILGPTCDKTRRNEGICEAHFRHGYSMTEIGAHLGLGCSSISKIIKQYDLHNSRFKM